MVSVTLFRAMTFVPMTLIAIAGAAPLMKTAFASTTQWIAANLLNVAKYGKIEMADTEELRIEIERLRALAERVCWFDWSDNDPDAVSAIDDLRKALKEGRPHAAHS